jgi:hypothetical protein
MPLVSVTDILFQSDEFWANSTLDSLRKLVGTSKGFKVTLQDEDLKVKKKNNTSLPPSLTIQAMTVMMERRPAANAGWELRWVDAKHWFMLNMKTMAVFCTRLPAESPFHLSEEEAEKAQEKRDPFVVRFMQRREDSAYISFMDAYKLTLNTGLKEAMKRRAHFDQGLMDSAFETLNFQKPSDTMRKNIRAAIRVLRANEQTAKVKKGIRLLNKLDEDFWSVNNNACMIKDWMKMRPRNVERFKLCISEYKTLRQTITKRYKAHSVYCPEKMPTEFLDA